MKQHVNRPIENVNSKISEVGKPVEQKAVDTNHHIGDKTEKVETNVQQVFDKCNVFQGSPFKELSAESGQYLKMYSNNSL